MRLSSFFAILTTAILLSGTSQYAVAEEEAVYLRCQLTDEFIEWLKSLASAEVKENFVSFLPNFKKGSEIKLTFNDIMLDENWGMRLGTLNDEETSVIITDEVVSFLTPDETGSGASLLDRYTGKFYFYFSKDGYIEYDCDVIEKKF